MSTEMQSNWWESLRHIGLLLSPEQVRRIDHDFCPAVLSEHRYDQLRREMNRLAAGQIEAADLVTWVLENICGLVDLNGGMWKRASHVPADYSRLLVSGEACKPRHVWVSNRGGVLPIFIDRNKAVGLHRGRKTLSDVTQWLRLLRLPVALLTNGRQWRLVHAGLDYEAACEWDTELWFSEGEPSLQLYGLRVLFQPELYNPPSTDAAMPLATAIANSRRGQSELSAVLGERVREAVEHLVHAHGEALKRAGLEPHGAEIYRAASRVVMRLVFILFAESRELLPRSNPVYHTSYSLQGLLDQLQKLLNRGRARLATRFGAWPRILALFQLIREGSHHVDLNIRAYGSELFAPGSADLAAEPVTRALHVFENACFDTQHNTMPDGDVCRMLELLTRTPVRIRQGRGSTSIMMPVDFSDLLSEYIGILYEGLLDYELRTAPGNDPIVFLAIGDEPALPLSRLEGIEDSAIKDLLESMKQRAADEGGEADGEAAESETAEAAGAAGEPEPIPSDDAAVEATEEPAEPDAATVSDAARQRAWAWGRRACELGGLVKRPRGRLTPERLAAHENAVEAMSRRLIRRVVLPGEWYLVRWGGTRKGAGSFYTRPQLALPTVHRTLRPLAYEPPKDSAGIPLPDAPPDQWTPRKPEEILALKVCDIACGSGSFDVAALRFLTDALWAAIHAHGRLTGDGYQRPLDDILGLDASISGESAIRLPCPPDADDFEPRTKAVLRRYVVERCIYGVDLDPLAVELCRLALWIETMDRNIPFSFLDHKIKCGNALLGTWFDQFRHYPVMAWKREGGDKNHTNGVHFQKEARTQALKDFLGNQVKPALESAIIGRQDLFVPQAKDTFSVLHAKVLAELSAIHNLPVQDSAERAKRYADLQQQSAWRELRAAFDQWCAIWFWPADRLDIAPLPTSVLSNDTAKLTAEIARRKRFFHWELEFPDVFAAAGSGFHGMVGNPPWDVAKPNSKEFFSNIDPLYRTYGKQEALSRQTAYFADRAVELAWLNYGADFKAQSNFVGATAFPYGDPADEDKGGEKFSIARGKENGRLHAAWRTRRSGATSYADPYHPFRHQGSADLNLYKLFLEQAHALLRDGGRLGYIIPSGLYSDHGSGGLRTLFLDHCSWEWLFGFENRDKIFDIDSRFKFNPVIIQKGGKTAAIRTAFMRRRLEDWAEAEKFATPYTHEQISRFSPGSYALLEVATVEDLTLMDMLSLNAPVLGEMVGFTQQYDMTGDSKYFPPLPTWQTRGYHPNEFDIWKDSSSGVALPVLEGRMIDHFDAASKAWVSGRGRSAVWEDVPDGIKSIKPQFLIDYASYADSQCRIEGYSFFYMKIASATNARSLIGTIVRDLPSVYSICVLRNDALPLVAWLCLGAYLNSFMFDFVVRLRLVGLNITGYILRETPVVIIPSVLHNHMARIVGCLCFSHIRYAPEWLKIRQDNLLTVSWKRLWAVSSHERLRSRCVLDAAISAISGVTQHQLQKILADTDFAVCSMTEVTKSLNPKGFWRVDKDKDPELRHTVLTLVAFHDLQAKIAACGNDRDKGIEAFLDQNNGEGWMLPETLRLADYGLGHDDRAKEHQPVASRLGPRFFDWQLAQSPEESWRECELHARNLLGETGYKALLEEIEREKRGEPTPAVVREPAVEYKVKPGLTQAELF